MRKARIALAWLVTTTLLAGAGVTTAVMAAAAVTLYTATTEVNVRTGPSTGTSTLHQLKKGDVVEAKGSAKNGWQPISFSNTTAYVYAQYVKLTKSTKTPITNAAPGPRATSANVNLRTAASLDSTIVRVLKKGTEVAATGRKSGDFTEVTVDGQVRWLFTKYVGATASGPAQPAPDSVADPLATSTPPDPSSLRYVIATALNVRKGADVESAKITTVSNGTALQVTGLVQNGYTQIIFNGALAWVASSYLSTTPPPASLGSASLDKLKASGKAAVLVVREQFPEITSIYGWRASSAYSSDHPNGLAIDIMIPSYKKNKALGDRIAQYFIDNNKALNVKYVIWRQRNYTIARGTWVHMSDRGGDTANHYDHVHVSFLS